MSKNLSENATVYESPTGEKVNSFEGMGGVKGDMETALLGSSNNQSGLKMTPSFGPPKLGGRSGR